MKYQATLELLKLTQADKLARAIAVMEQTLEKAKRCKTASTMLTTASWGFAEFSNRIVDAIETEAVIVNAEALNNVN